MRRLMFAAAMAMMCGAAPAAADENVTVEVIAADWMRNVEIWHVCCGRSPTWRHQFTNVARGAYPEPPEWPFATLDAHRPQREKSKRQAYILTVKEAESDNVHLVLTSQDAWERAAEAGQMELLRGPDGTLSPHDDDKPVNAVRVQDFGRR